MKLNGTTIPKPHSFDMDYEEIAKKERVASGKLVKDMVAIKRLYNLTYRGLKPNDMKAFINIFKTGKAVEFEYEDAEGTVIVNVSITSLPRSIYLCKPEYSLNVIITFEEE